MFHHVFAEISEGYPIAILVKASSFDKHQIISAYVEPLHARGVPKEDMIAFSLSYNSSGKAPAKYIKEYLDQLLPELLALGTRYLYVTDANYFKVLTRQAKAAPHFGYVLPCALDGYENLHVILGINHQQLIYDPKLQQKLDMSLDVMVQHKQGSYQELGSTIIHSAQYPEGPQAIQEALNSLHQYDALTCDIEAFSLAFNEAGIGTIAFAWDEHNGIAFTCDYRSYQECPSKGVFGYQQTNDVVRSMLLDFFTSYKGTLIWHNAAYDVKVIIFTLWMQDPLDTKGLLEGLEIMTRSIEDTKVIAYLALNSTSGNELGLKALAHEFAGNWAQDEIKDIRNIPQDKLLQYNLVDTLSTWFVYKKQYPQMVQDKQENLYHTLMLPSLKAIIQMELTGMPLEPSMIQVARQELEALKDSCLNVFRTSPVIQEFNHTVQRIAMETANAKLKVKQHPIERFKDVVFNPNSGPQLQRLLYEQMGLPVLDYTETMQAATGGDTLEKLINHTQNPGYKEILEALIGFGKVDKILSAFIPNFEKGLLKENGKRYLHGSFNLGGTVSGRLSSSKP